MNDSEKNTEEEDTTEAAVEEQAASTVEEEQSPEAEPEIKVEVPAGTEEEVEPLQTQLLRLSADFDNFRKRTRREKEVWSQQAQERIITDLLTVVDHYELGLKNAEDQEAKSEVLDGFRMVHSQFLTILNRYGVEPVATNEVDFNPEVHEAVSFMHSPDVAENAIIAETRKGYTMGDKLIRAAQVVVSSGPPADASAESELSDEEA